MERARFALALPDDPDLIQRLTTALNGQENPPISMRRSGETVFSFEAATWDGILRSRVVEALEAAAGPDWQTLARTLN